MSDSVRVNVCEFFVDGMHCAACEIVVEKKLSKHEKVKLVKAELSSQKVIVHIEEGYGAGIEDLNALLAGSGYTLQHNKITATKTNYTELGKAFLISLGFIGLFILLQKLGIVNLVRTNQVTLPFVFLVGIVASLSTCMAVVGGLVLSLSSSYVKSDRNGSIPLVKFHLSRLIGFFILGGLIGLLGSAFTLTPVTTFLLNLTLFFVMVILGIGLLDVFPSLRKFQFRMPKLFGNKIVSEEGKKSYMTPILLGASTFFLPCGFTQSMQLYSLTTGSFVNGALTMFVFALGTLPVLALISFASVKLASSLQSKLFFKTAGFIVLFFALFNFLGALVAIGLLQPLFSI